MSTEITRRDFLELVFTTASVSAVSGGIPIWPSNALARPVAEPARLSIDSCGYIIDGTFKYCADLPTYREHLGINGLSAEEARKVLESEVDRFEGIVADSENWSFPGMFIKCCFQLACFSECDFHGVTIVSTRMFVIGMYD